MRWLCTRSGLFGVMAAVAVATSLAGAGVQSTQAASPPDLIDVVSLAGTTSAAQATSIVPILSSSGGPGTVGAPIALPTAAAGSQNPLTMSGSAGSEGSLNLSGNGQYVTLAGYAATPGTASVASTASSSTKRVAGRIDGNGNIDTSTALNAFTANNVRAAVTNDGTHVWMTGAGSGDSPKTAVYYASVGGSSGAGVVTPSPTGARDLVIAGGNLYLSTTTTVTQGIYEVGSGLPTSSASTTALVTGASLDPYGFALVQLGAGPGVDTLYVADGTAGGITKYSLSGGSWVSKGTVGAGTKLFGLAAKVEGGGVQLYATTANVVAGNTVVSFFDSSGAGATISSGSFTTVATAPAGTTYRGVSFAPSGQTLSTAPPTISLADPALSRAIGDSYQPNQTTATISDSVYPASQLTVTATSDNSAVVPSVTVSGAGSPRTLTVTSNDVVGLANVTVTVSTPDGRSASTVLQYGVSGPAPDATSNYLYDFANASTAIDVGGGYFIVGDDEFNNLALYQAGVSGPPLKTWNFDTQMGVADTSQIDIEAAAQLGNTIYWFGSEGNNSTGDVKANRAILFATTITGAGASTDLNFEGYYRNMRNDLLAWDQANGNQFGFTAGAAQGQIPKEVNGFNIEGAEFAAGGSSTLYLGFRAPIVPTSNRTQALVVPVTNLASLISPSGTGGAATFGAPFFWNLTPPGYVNPLGDTSALGVREIRKNADDQYLIVAGSYEGVPAAPSGGAEYLYTWDGNVAHQPVLTNTVLPTPDAGSWETIVSVPDPLTDGSSVRLIADNGDNDYYNTGVEAKDLTTAPSPLMKDRTDVISVLLPSQTVVFTSIPPSPAAIGSSYGLTATGGASGNAVVFARDPASVPGACSVTGSQVSLTGPGTCVVDADQAGTFQYLAGHATQSFQVVDRTPPVLTVPSNLTAEATGSTGAAVDYASAAAVDAVDGPVPASCSPASGSTFALGVTTVNCSASDTSGNTAHASFAVTVVDTTPPVLTVSSDLTAEATGSSGAVVDYEAAAALDAVDGSVRASCLPASGSTFALGATTVNCSASDTAGNTAQASFIVTVVDTTPPVLTLPVGLSLDVPGGTGAVVSYGTSATDAVAGPVAVDCAPASGSVFPLGATTVHCSAADSAGNVGSGTFVVTARLRPDHFKVTVSATAMTAGQTFTATVIAQDASNHTLTGYSGPVTLSDTSGSLSVIGPVVWSGGVATATVSVGTAVTRDRVSATDSSFAVAPTGTSTAVIAVTSTVLGYLHVSGSPTTVSVGDQVTFQVAALDAASQPIVGFSGPLTLSDTSGTLNATSVTWSNGVATVTASVGVAIARERITAASGSVSGATAVFNVLGPVASLHVSVLPATSVTRGSTETVTVAAYDSAGQILTGFAGPVTLTDVSGGMVELAPPVWLAGIATINVSFPTLISRDRVTASDGAGHGGQSAVFAVVLPTPV